MMASGPIEFPAFLLPGEKKVLRRLPDGSMREYIPRAFVPGFFIYSDEGFYARALRDAEPWEKDSVMSRSISALVTLDDMEKHGIYYCHPSQLNQVKDLRINFPAPLYLAENLSLLEPIKAWIVHRLGRNVLVYAGLDNGYPMEFLSELRVQIDMPDIIAIGRFEEKAAFYFAREKHEPVVMKLARAALEYVGASMELIVPESGNFRVTYKFGDERSQVLIDDRLNVVSSGICLSGRDRDYDLGSVVLVKHRRNYHDDDE